MKLANKTVGFAITGSFCTFAKIKTELIHLTREGVNVIPIFHIMLIQLTVVLVNQATLLNLSRIQPRTNLLSL